jgi:hypothetical protein
MMFHAENAEVTKRTTNDTARVLRAGKRWER